MLKINKGDIAACLIIAQHKDIYHMILTQGFMPANFMHPESILYRS